ncbi:hypothetical protein ACLKA7_015005 [Drosophila subpalustris]
MQRLAAVGPTVGCTAGNRCGSQKSLCGQRCPNLLVLLVACCESRCAAIKILHSSLVAAASSILISLDAAKNQQWSMAKQREEQREATTPDAPKNRNQNKTLSDTKRRLRRRAAIVVVFVWRMRDLCTKWRRRSTSAEQWLLR